MVRISYLACLFNGAKYSEVDALQDFLEYKRYSCNELVLLVNTYFEEGNRYGYKEFLMRTWEKYKK